MTAAVMLFVALVSITLNPASVTECEFVTTVKASAASVVVTPSANKHVERQALKRLRILTHRKGGNTVLVTSIISDNGRARATGEAYRCEVAP